MFAALVTLLLVRWTERRPVPRADAPAVGAEFCRTCEYAVKDLARCPECGDADPRGPRRYFLTRLGAWFHAGAWRRWGLRAFVVAWIGVGLLLPAIAGSAQMLGARAGWW